MAKIWTVDWTTGQNRLFLATNWLPLAVTATPREDARAHAHAHVDGAEYTRT